MSDFALYRAVEPYVGKFRGAHRDASDGIIRLEMQLPQNVSTIYRATVNGKAAPALEMLSSRLALVGLPAEFEDLAPSQLEVVLHADATLEQTEKASLPASIGFGLRATLYDGEMQALQSAVRSLMMSAGTDIWDRSRGGGLLKVKGVLVDPSDTTRIARIGQIAVDRYNANVSTRRSKSPRRPQPQYQVVRMELLSARAIRVREADSRLLGKLSRTEAARLSGSNEVALAFSIGHDLRGPQGRVSRISSAVAV